MLIWLATFAAAEPTLIDLAPYAAWRTSVAAALEAARAGCPAADLQLRFALSIGPDGVLRSADGSPPRVDVSAPPVTTTFKGTDRAAAAYAKADETKRCFVDALGALAPMPPPGARGVSLPDLWFDFGARFGARSSPPVADGPRLQPPTLDSDEVRDAQVAVIWAGEADVWACAPDAKVVDLHFVVSRDGSVASVAPIADLPPEAAACVVRVVSRWAFPPTGVNTRTAYRFSR